MYWFGSLLWLQYHFTNLIELRQIKIFVKYIIHRDLTFINFKDLDSILDEEKEQQQN